MTVVDTIYSDFKSAADALGSAGQISHQIMIEDNLRKTLLLSAASYFELQLTKSVKNFSDDVTSGNDLIRSLIQQKAISRQYHTWFDWDKSNANKFFGLFGVRFKSHMSDRIANSDNLENDIKAFLTIGNLRNLLVHSDFASYYIDQTSDEIYKLYQQAFRFVGVVGQELKACSECPPVVQ